MLIHIRRRDPRGRQIIQLWACVHQQQKQIFEILSAKYILLKTNISIEKCSFDLIQSLKIHIKQWENYGHPITSWPISAIEWTLLVTVCAGDIFSSEGETRFKPPPFLRALALKTSKCFLRSEKRKHLQLTHSYQSQHNTFHIEVLLQHWDNKLVSWEAHKQTHWQATRLTDEKRTRGQEDKMIWYDICQYFLLSEQVFACFQC